MENIVWLAGEDEIDSAYGCAGHQVQICAMCQKKITKRHDIKAMVMIADGKRNIFYVPFCCEEDEYRVTYKAIIAYERQARIAGATKERPEVLH